MAFKQALYNLTVKHMDALRKQIQSSGVTEQCGDHSEDGG